MLILHDIKHKKYHIYTGLFQWIVQKAFPQISFCASFERLSPVFKDEPLREGYLKESEAT